MNSDFNSTQIVLVSNINLSSDTIGLSGQGAQTFYLTNINSVLPSMLTNQVVFKNYFVRYKNISESDWYKRNYYNKSLGDFLYIDL